MSAERHQQFLSTQQGRNTLLQFAQFSKTNLGHIEKPHFWTKSLKSGWWPAAVSGCGPHRNLVILPMTDAGCLCQITATHINLCFTEDALSTEHQPAWS